jgi:hypothetical protein
MVARAAIARSAELSGRTASFTAGRSQTYARKRPTMALSEPQARVDAAEGPHLDALVEKYRGRRFEELLRDPGFARLSPSGVEARAAEHRRQTKRLWAETEEAWKSFSA